MPKAKAKSLKSPRRANAKAVKVSGVPRKRKPSPLPGKSGPRLDVEQKAVLVMLLASGEAETAINDFFRLARWGKLASSTLSHYRKLYAKDIAEAKTKRIDEAMTTGLALKAERIAALKIHAEQLAALRWVPADNGRLWNERAYRQCLADIAIEMGDRKPKDAPAEQTVKVYLGLDPEKI